VARTTKERMRDQARALRRQGSSMAVIGEALGVTDRTVRRWAKDDADAGRPWRWGKGVDFIPTPEHFTDRMCSQLMERLARLIEAGDDPEHAEDAARLEDRMLKVCRVLEHLKSDHIDLEQQLVGLKRFAAFCMRNMTEQEMEPVRRAIRQFLDEMREEHS